MTAIVSYSVGTYSGEIEVYYDDPDVDDGELIAKAKRIVFRNSPRPAGMYAESWKVRRDD
ncbi:MAG: hypothetical protein LBO72_07360 [Helicobacteraceae bacterium]|jgi:hypothetical protein|nr:hypothetical protein [Helicobacteraceae bacterium]